MSTAIDWAELPSDLAEFVLAVVRKPWLFQSDRMNLAVQLTGYFHEGLKVGAKLMSGPTADILLGNSLQLKNIPAGTVVHNIELRPGKGAQMARSAGAQAQLVSREGGVALLRLPSGEVRRVSDECMATVGAVGNSDHENVSSGKAGRTRWLGKMPHNRGVSMNPVDHPHGGGEGKTSGGRHPVTPWGQPTRGFKTRNNKRTDKFIVSRKAKKR